MLPTAAALLMFAAVAGQPADPEREIVVTGQRLGDTRNALDACIARACPPRQEIAATLAHTENLFVAGRYDDAQGVAARGIARNRRFARDLPIDVAGLLRAHARLSAHLGEVELARASTLGMINALRAGLDDRDSNVLTAQVELAHLYAKQGAFGIAEANYRRIAQDARSAGQPRIEGYARFRHGMLLATLAQKDAMYEPRARATLRALADRTDPELAGFANAARLGLLRLAIRGKAPQDIDRMIGELAQRGTTTRPALLYGEPVKLVHARANDDSGSATARMSADIVADQWIDVAFLIGTDGLPQEIETVRTSAGYTGGWADAVIDAIRTRRYAPLTIAPGEPGLFRVERYTKTAPLVAITGSRMRQRSANATIEMVDLSTDPAAAAAPSRPVT